jgi:hypothetical protein
MFGLLKREGPRLGLGAMTTKDGARATRSGLLKCWASPMARHYNGVKDEATGSGLLGLAFGSAV